MKAHAIPIRLLVMAVILALPGTLLAQEPNPVGTTRYVDNLGDCAGLIPCHTTIMDAVNAAAPYDSIQVFPGVYHEAVVFDRTKHNIALGAHARALMPVIAAPPGGDNAVTLDAPGVQVRSFILEAPEGAGVWIKGPDEIRDGATDAVVQGNLIKAARGVVFSGSLRSVVTNNTVVGGGITVVSGHTRGCLIEGNALDGASIDTGGCKVKTDNVVRRNVVRGGGISFLCGDPLQRNTVDSNRVQGDGIGLNGYAIVDANVIRRNLVRGGGIGLVNTTGRLGSNTIELNFVSGSTRDGIALHSSYGGAALVRKNTSVENARCDINDTQSFPSPYRNIWMENRFGTKCGAATD